LEYHQARAKRRQRQAAGGSEPGDGHPAGSGDGRHAVGVYRRVAKPALTSPHPQEVPTDDQQTSARCRPRAPPPS
jgi:hypothetical protein